MGKYEHMNTLSINDIDESVQSKISTQSYAPTTIQGIQIINLNVYTTEDGSFTEVLRIHDTHILDSIPDFHIAQINKSVMLPGSVKAWHLHYNQDEVWNVTGSTHLLLGLWDIREHSETKGMSLKIPITNNRLVYIPRGVAHGAANISGKPAEILYFVSQQYNKDQPDEQRLPWDSLGSDFWEAKKE